MRARRVAAAAAVMTVVGTALASLAWACTAWTGMYPLSEPMGPPGTKVTVRGTSPIGGPVQVRWDGLQGPVMATVQAPPASGGHDSGGVFSTQVVIPKAAPGVHYVVVDAGKGGWSRAAFKIPGKPGAMVSPVDEPGIPNPALTSDRLWKIEPQTPRPVGSSAVPLGMGLLAVGTVTMVGAFGTLGIRRARARSTYRTD